MARAVLDQVGLDRRAERSIVSDGAAWAKAAANGWPLACLHFSLENDPLSPVL
jgi:hypothetical protein